MMGFGILLLTLAVVMLIISIALFIDARREYKNNVGKVSRNFGFGKKQIDIDRKGQHK